MSAHDELRKPLNFPELLAANQAAGAWTLIAPTGAVLTARTVEELQQLVAAVTPMHCPLDSRPLAAFHPMPMVNN